MNSPDYSYKESGKEIIFRRTTNISGIVIRICVLLSILMSVTIEIVQRWALNKIANTDSIFSYVVSEEIVYICLLLLVVSITTVLNFHIHSESILVLPEVGICVKITNGLGKVSSQFYDRGQIRDVFIVEAISMQCIASYLAVRLQSGDGTSDKIYPVFKKSQESMKELQSVYRHIQRTLFYNKNCDIS